MTTTTMSLPDDAPCPRLCHLVKWPDFDGYGFNLHAEKTKIGQFIGKVDDDSPAQLAGLREGDKIIEVNFVNISNENHRQVVERIKSITNETRLLVVDDMADKWYRDRKLVIRSSQPNVICYRTPVPRPAPGMLPIPCSPESEIPNRPPTQPSAVMNHNSIKAEEQQHNPSNVEVHKSKTTENLIRASSSLSNGIGGSSNASSSSKADSVTNSPLSSHSSSNDINTAHDDRSNNSLDLNLNMTAAQMRQLIAQRKKKDAKHTNLDLREKYEIIQQM